LKKGDSQEPEDKLEIVDLADISGLHNYRTNSKPDPDDLDLADLADDDLSFPDEHAFPETLNHKPESLRPRGRPARPSRNGKPGVGGINRDKPIFPSSIAADILSLHPRTLRIYEELGLVVPFRTETQRRRYSNNDISKTRFIQFLTQTRRVNLEGVRIILQMLNEMRQLGVHDPVRRVFGDYHDPENSGPVSF
jgi:DNA-binding transcriptional MerR regulator